MGTRSPQPRPGRPTGAEPRASRPHPCRLGCDVMHPIKGSTSLPLGHGKPRQLPKTCGVHVGTSGIDKDA